MGCAVTLMACATGGDECGGAAAGCNGRRPGIARFAGPGPSSRSRPFSGVCSVGLSAALSLPCFSGLACALFSATLYLAFFLRNLLASSPCPSLRDRLTVRSVSFCCRIVMSTVSLLAFLVG